MTEINLNVNIEDYVSKSEIKEVILDEIRCITREHYGRENQFQRLIGNLSYDIVFAAIDEITKTTGEENVHEILNKKVADAINNVTSFEVFRRSDCFGNKDSIATELLNKAVKDNADLIDNKVKKIMETYLSNVYIIKDDIEAIIEDSVKEALGIKE